MSTEKISKDDFYLGHQLRHVRKLRGMSQDDVAEILGITKSYISNIELGKRIPGRHVKVVLENWLRSGGAAQQVNSETVITAEDMPSYNNDTMKIAKKDQPAPEINVHEGVMMTTKVLSSKTGYANALWHNLKSFEAAVDKEERVEELTKEVRELKEMMMRMEARLTKKDETDEKKQAAS